PESRSASTCCTMRRDFFAIDCALVTATAAAQFLERERHGEPRVLFDRDHAISARPLDRSGHAERLQIRFAQIRAAWPVYRRVVEKELARGRALDAIGFYFGGLLRPLVELLACAIAPNDSTTAGAICMVNSRWGCNASSKRSRTSMRRRGSAHTCPRSTASPP